MIIKQKYLLKHRNLLVSEFLKILTNSTFLFFFLILIIMNLILLYSNSNSNIMDPTAYKELHTDLKTNNEIENITYITEMNRKLSAMEQIYYEDIRNEIYEIHQIDESLLIYEGVTTDEFREFRALLHSGEYLEYTNNIIEEANLFRECYKEVSGIAFYKEYLQDIENQGNLNTQISIFKKSGSDYSIRNILKTVKDFNGLKEVTPKLVASKGITKATQFIPTDVIAIFAIFTIGIFLIIHEKEKCLFNIIRPTKLGRTNIIIVKMIVMISLCFLITVFLWGGNYFLCGNLYGFINLMNPVQSLEGYTSCVLPISIGQYIVLFIISKFLIYSLIGLIFFYFAISSKYSILYTIKAIILIGISFLFYTMISNNSIFQTLKYINLIEFLMVTPIYRYYLNLNIFHYPVNIINCFIISSVIIFILIIFASVHTYCTSESTEYQKLNITAFKHKIRRANTSLFSHELFKLLRDNKVIVVLILLIAVQAYAFSQPQKPLTYIEFYYKRYVNSLEGKVTEDKLKVIEKEQADFDRALQKMNDLQNQYGNGEITKLQFDFYLKSLQEDLKYIDGFNKLIERMNFLHNYQLENGKKLWLVYEKGWYSLMAEGEQGHEVDMKKALILVLGMILSFSAVFSTEYSTGMIQIISVYKRGRHDMFRSKILLCILLTTIIFIITYLPGVISAMQIHGLNNLFAPLKSLPNLQSSVIHGTIFNYIIMLYFIRYITAIMIMMIILWISIRFGNLLLCTIYSILIFVVPICIHLLNMKFLDKISFNIFLSGNMILNPEIGSDIIKTILLYTGFLLPFLIALLFYYKIKKGFVMRGI